MFISYMKAALRHLFNNKLYALLNIVGLVVALSCCILIALYVRHELSFDRYQAKAAHIFRISRDYTPSEGNDFELHLATNAPQVAPLLKADFPEVKAAARMNGMGYYLTRNGISFYDRNLWVDNEIFTIFDFEWIQGRPETALVEPYSVVLTQSAAKRYFGSEDPLGQTLLVQNDWPVEVTGVIADLPDNTHLNFAVLGSLSTLESRLGGDYFTTWGGNNFYTYVLLNDPADAAVLQEQSESFFARHMAEEISVNTGYTVTPLTDIHLHSHRELEMATPGNAATIYGLTAIAIFILLIACINFVNLSTAKSAKRAVEVGVRKAIGARRHQLAVQFLGESMLLAILAMLLSVALVELLIPSFNTLTGKNLNLNYLGNVAVLDTLVLITLFVGLVAGTYPALLLSRFRPALVLKGNVTLAAGGALLRKLLVVVQFSIAIALIATTSVVYLQLRFANTLELGFEKDQVIALAGDAGGVGSEWPAFKRELLMQPQIRAVTASNLTPGTQNLNARSVRVEGPVGERTLGLPFMYVDYDFFETYGIDILAGRTFDESFGADRMLMPDADNPQTSGNYILNELAAAQLGWTAAEAVGQRMDLAMSENFATSVNGIVVGVVKNAQFESIRTAIRPLVYMIPPAELGFQLQEASIRISGRDTSATLAYIDRLWAQFRPAVPLARRFIDQDLAALYRSEEKQAQVFSGFSLTAIVISCLGLFGLASYSTQRRTKEIGVRKVMGGSVWSIVLLLTNDFSKLVLLSNLIAWPIAYFAMNRWLENFAYRVDLTPLIFIGSGLTALCIAWVTVGGTAAKAASAKPLLALRYE